MKSLIAGAALVVAAIPALAQTNVSISVGQPGFYGHINVGDFGPPPVVYEQPVIIQQPARYYEAAPVYLRVPEGHRKHWARFCGRYNACGQRVYFVQDNWYTNTYVPRYREHYRAPERHDYYQRPPERHEYREEWHGEHGRGHGEGHDEDHEGHGEGHEGHGEGHGNGHGHGHD